MEFLKRNSTKDVVDKYSFFKYKRSSILGELDSQNDMNDNFDEKENDEDINTQDVGFFFVNDGIVIEYYDQESGYTALYRDVSNNTLEVLYESQYYPQEETEVSYIYQPNGMYTISHNLEGSITAIAYISKEKFIALDKISSKFLSNIPIIKRFQNFGSDIFMNKHVKTIMAEGQLTSSSPEITKHYNAARRLDNRYNLVSQYIIACRIIANISEKVNHYIATRQLDKNELLRDYMQLSNFAKISSGTIEDLSGFIVDPKKTDLRKLCDTLDKRSKNLSYFIDFYLEEELKEDSLER